MVQWLNTIFIGIIAGVALYFCVKNIYQFFTRRYEERLAEEIKDGWSNACKQVFGKPKGGVMSVIAIPNVLREKLGEPATEALVEILDKVEEKSHAHTLEVIEEKFERRLAEENGKLRAEMIKWMFIFTFGQYWFIVGTITGILFAFFRK